MRSMLALGSLMVGLAGLLCLQPAYAGEEGEKEEKIPLDQVPENVKKAAAAAVPGIVFTEAEKETKGSVTIYELEGKAGEKEYEVEVSAEGKVLKVEEEDDDDGDDDDDDGDDD